MRITKSGLARFASTGLFLLLATPAPATESLSYAPVQTEREVQFVSLDLDLKDELTRLEGRIGHAPTLEYAMIDLDADNDPELFIRIQQGENCEVACTVLAFSRAQNTWMRVLETATPDVTVAKKTTKGYRDLLIASQPWSWTGRRYAAAR